MKIKVNIYPHPTQTGFVAQPDMDDISSIWSHANTIEEVKIKFMQEYSGMNETFQFYFED